MVLLLIVVSSYYCINILYYVLLYFTLLEGDMVSESIGEIEVMLNERLQLNVSLAIEFSSDQRYTGKVVLA